MIVWLFWSMYVSWCVTDMSRSMAWGNNRFCMWSFINQTYNQKRKKKKEEKLLLIPMNFRSIAVTGGLLPTAKNTVLEFGHCDPKQIFSSVCFPWQENLSCENCNIWVNLEGVNWNSVLLIRDSWILVAWKCHLKCKSPFQIGLASSQNHGGKLLRKGFIAEMNAVKILRVQFSLWCLGPQE